MHPVTFAWLCAVVILGTAACGDRPAVSSGSGGDGARPEDIPSGEGICGDAVVDPEHGACDDANDREGDGCNSDCRPSGERVWCLDAFGPPGDATPTALAVGPSGNIAVIGTASEAGISRAWLDVVDASGSPRWSTRLDGAAGIGVAFLPDGMLAAAVHEAGAASSRVATFSLEGARASNWTGISGRVAPRALAAGSEGIIVVAGDRGNADEAWLATFSSSLSPQDEVGYRPPQGIDITARALAIDHSGTIFLGADVLLEPFESDAGVPRGGVAIAALLPSGEVTWEHVFEPPPDRSLLLASLTALPDGSVVATGAFRTGPITSRAWTASVSESGVIWESVEEADDAAAYGTSVSGASDPDFFRTQVAGPEGPTAPAAALFGRYDARGEALWERESSSPARQTHALVSARSGADLSVVFAGLATPIPAGEPARPWLCKYTE